MNISDLKQKIKKNDRLKPHGTEDILAFFHKAHTPSNEDDLLMERGQAKAVTGKEHLERNDFIIKKQKAELQRIEETKRHKEQQVSPFAHRGCSIFPPHRP